MTTHSERANLIITLIIFFLVITYVIIAFYVIPEYYNHNPKYEMFLNYSLTAVVTLVYTGTLIASYLDLVEARKK